MYCLHADIKMSLKPCMLKINMIVFPRAVSVLYFQLNISQY